MKKVLSLLLTVVALFVLVGCSSNPLSGGGSIFTDKDMAAKAISQLKERSELKGKDLKVFQNVVIFDQEGVGNMIDINILKPGTTDQVDNYKYKGGTWTGPNPVKITGSGNMEDNVQSIDAIDFSKIPEIYKICETKAKEIDKAKVEKTLIYILDINTGNYRAVIDVKSDREEYTATFDGKGNLLDFKKQ